MHNSKPARTNREAKTGQIIRIEQEQLNRHLDKMVRGTVERTLNELLDAEVDRLCGGIGFKGLFAPLGAKVDFLAGMAYPSGRVLRIDTHAADRVDGFESF